MKKIAICTLMAMIATTATLQAKEKSEVRVIEVGQDVDAANEGVIFALPTTMLRVRVEAEVEMCKVGPYYRYSNKYLNLTDVITEDKTTWRLISATISSYGKSGDQNTQKYKMIAMNAVCPSVCTTSDGVIMGVNVEAQQPINETISQELELPILTFDNVQLDRTILTKTSTATMAEEVALSIYDLRDKRLSLLGGEEPVVLQDAGSYEKVLSEIDRLEKDLVSMFAGKRVKVRVVKYYDIMPDCYGASSQVLLRFSDKDGFLDAMDLNGKPVYVDMSFTKPAQVNALSAQSKERRAKPLYGLRYIQPATVNVKVIDRNKLIGESNVLCSQGGQILTLPADVLLQSNVSIKLSPVTGALEYIKYNK